MNINSSDLSTVVCSVVHNLFDSPDDLARHWTLIQQIAASTGIEDWWHGELLGQLLRKKAIPSLGMTVFSEYKFSGSKRLDLLLGFPTGPWNNTLPVTNDTRKPYIPIELKHMSDLNGFLPQYLKTGGKTGSLYDEAVALYNREKFVEAPCTFLILLVTGLTKPEVYEDILIGARKFHPAEIPSGNLKLILDEKIQIKKKQILEQLGEVEDEYMNNACAHQFVWAITPRK